MESGIVASEKRVYEAESLRPDGTVCAGEVLECDDDAAIARAQDYARQWGRPIKLVGCRS